MTAKKRVQKPWKSANEVRRIWFTKDRGGRNVKIDRRGHTHARTWMGRIQFADGKIHRVAIKEYYGIDDREAAHFQTTIDALRAANIRTPKMAMLKMPLGAGPKGTWMQVSELFGSTQYGSKLAGTYPTIQQRKLAMIEFAKMAKAGIGPWGTATEWFTNRKPIVLTFDLDSVTVDAPPESIAGTLFFLINNMSKTRKEKNDLTRLTERIIKGNPAVFAAWKKRHQRVK